MTGGRGQEAGAQKGLGNEVAPAPLQLSPTLIQHLVENQAKDLAIRGEEVKLRVREMDAGHRYAEKALDAQARDRTEVREAAKAARRDRLVFLSFVVGVLVFALGWLIANGHKDFAMAVLKALVFLLSGGAGGYFVAKNRSRGDEGQQKP